MVPPIFYKSCLINLLCIAFIIAAALLMAVGLNSLRGADKPEQKEYAMYEVNYIHLSGAKMTTRLYLDAGGIDLKVGFCEGSYFIYDDSEFQNSHPCNTNTLIYGATDIISFKKVKDEHRSD
jgi:hypothetical protein